ncbi:hypothetical protein LTR17_022199 [Elasticomyces elasticus]|nr:hypothetical protein LTR17_022199 [Elasticomyces elasticus]
MAVAAASSQPSQIPATAMASDSMIIPQRPFRLMALPPELRVTIYRFALLLCQPVVLISDYHSTGKIGQHSLPTLTKVSRTLWNEAAPIYYSINTFQFRLGSGSDAEIIGFRYSEVLKWACKHEPLIKQLRYLTILSPHTKTPLIAAQLSIKTGLSVQYVHPKLAASRKLLDRHAEIVEQYRNREDLAGEALIVMLGLGPSDWHELKRPSCRPTGEAWSVFNSGLHELVRYTRNPTPDESDEDAIIPEYDKVLRC